MILLAYLYLFVGIIYTIIEVIYIERVKILTLISVFRVMYAFIYGFLPAIILFRINNCTTSLTMIASQSVYFTNMSIALIISILEYIILNLAYNFTKNSKYYTKAYPVISEESLQISISVLLMFGIVSLFLWTRAFGSVWNLIIYADAVRARYSNIYNPAAFMEHFTKVFFMAFFVSFSLFSYKKRKKVLRIYTFVLLIVSLFFSLIVMMCTDARGSIGMIIVVVSLYYFNEKIACRNFGVNKAIRQIAIIVAVAFVAIIASEDIMNYLRTGMTVSADVGNTEVKIIDIIETEFGYTLQSQVAGINELVNNPFQYMVINDVLGSIFAWLPSRYIPFKLPVDLWDYNTQILNSYYTYYGQSPTDFVTASMYLFGWLGILIFPAFFGVCLKKIETLLRRSTYSPYLMVLYARFMYYCMWWVSHYSLRYTVLSLFEVFLTHIVIMFFHKILDRSSLVALSA